jgi:hypothetical protein
MFVRLKPIVVSSKKDSFTLTTSLRFYNESFRFAFVELLLEVFDVGRKHPRFGKKLKLLWEILLHRKKIFCK